MDMLKEYAGLVALAALIVGIIALVLASQTKKRVDNDIADALAGMSGAVTIGGDVTLSGTTKLKKALTVEGALSVTGDASVTGNASVTGDVTAQSMTVAKQVTAHDVVAARNVQANIGLISKDLLTVKGKGCCK